jgi:hypothetical protein
MHNDLSRLKVSGRADIQMAIQFNTDRQYWKEVLKRIIAVIKFLASRGLPLRWDNQTIGSVRNGNCLGIMELLSQFDPFFCEHIKKYGNTGKGIPSYLSVTICEEFIELMGSKLLAAIVTEIQKAMYFSISVDSTPYVTHINQLTFTSRYVKNAVPKEQFLRFIPIHGHKADHLADVTSFLKHNNISLMNCRGQSYDNATNISGYYSGLQGRFKEQSKYALYVPYVGHSINLAGVQAVDCNLNVTIYFDFVQNLYNFFSSSTHRWEILVSHLRPHLKVVKHLSKPRWSAHADAVTVLNDGYEDIKKSLDALLNDINQSSETCLIAQSLILPPSTLRSPKLSHPFTFL